MKQIINVNCTKPFWHNQKTTKRAGALVVELPNIRV